MCVSLSHYIIPSWIVPWTSIPQSNSTTKKVTMLQCTHQVGLNSSLDLETTYSDSHIFIILRGTSRQTLWWHITKSYCRYLLHSATSLTLRQYPENVSISSAHLAHFEHQLLVCDVWDCHDVIYAHHPFYIPCTPQTALLNQEYMSEFISTNTYMIHTKCRITNTVHNPVWQY